MLPQIIENWKMHSILKISCCLEFAKHEHFQLMPSVCCYQIIKHHIAWAICIIKYTTNKLLLLLLWLLLLFVVTAHFLPWPPWWFHCTHLLSCVFFPAPCGHFRGSKIYCSHLDIGLPFFLLPSGWEKVIFMQGTLSSILAMCPNHFSLAILIIFTMLGSLYKLYRSSSSSSFILHTPLKQVGP